MIIESLAFRNMGSYGNKWSTIELPQIPSFFQVWGQNGGGKSTALDIFKFGLYGKLEKKKLKDLANRFNKHGEVILKLKAKGDNITIERGVDPGYFRLFINGKEIDKAGKRSVQEYLEEEYLEMPFHVFSNTLSLSINDFKSFIRMNNNDKKIIIDKLFGLQILNQMRELLKQQIKKLKEELERHSASIVAYTNSLQKTENELASLTQRLNENSENRLSELKSSLTELKQNYKKNKDALVKVNEKISESVKNYSEIEKAIRAENEIVFEYEKKRKLYENKKCHVCESDFNNEFHKDILESHKVSADEAKQRLVEKTSLKSTISESKDKFVEIKEKIQKLVSVIEVKHSSIEKEIIKLEGNNNISEQTNSLEKIAKDAEDQIANSKKEQILTTKGVAFYNLVEEVLGDRGVKQNVINSILPALNSEIGKHIKQMGIEHQVVFNEEFNAKISHFGVEVGVETLSTGESKKIDFAVLLALIKLIKMMFPGINILFLDELFASLDGNSQHHVTRILREMCEEMKINIFIISHFPLVESDFDYIMHVTKAKGFSSFEINKVV